MKLTPSEVTHMRKTLAWLRCEYGLDRELDLGASGTLNSMLKAGYINQEQYDVEVKRQAMMLCPVPQYVRQGVKMLTKALRTYDGVKGAVLDVQSRDVQEFPGD